MTSYDKALLNVESHKQQFLEACSACARSVETEEQLAKLAALWTSLQQHIAPIIPSVDEWRAKATSVSGNTLRRTPVPAVYPATPARSEEEQQTQVSSHSSSIEPDEDEACATKSQQAPNEPEDRLRESEPVDLRPGADLRSRTDSGASRDDEDEAPDQQSDSNILLSSNFDAFKRDFLDLMRSATAKGADKHGFFKVGLPDVDEGRPRDISAKGGKGRIFSARTLNDDVIALTHVNDKAFVRQTQSGGDSARAGLAEEELVREFTSLLQKNEIKSVYRADRDMSVQLINKSPLYGLDGCILGKTRATIPGIHTPFSYESDGDFGAPFPIHTEDSDLCSVNILYTGRKIWILIPPSQKELLEKACRASNPDHYTRTCAQFLRHKSSFIPPDSLKRWGISYQIVSQTQGQALVTLPGTYHQGFSVDYTLSEAINYAEPGWSPPRQLTCTKRSCGSGAITNNSMALPRPTEGNASKPDLSPRKRDRPELDGPGPSERATKKTKIPKAGAGSAAERQTPKPPIASNSQLLDRLLGQIGNGRAIVELKDLCSYTTSSDVDNLPEKTADIIASIRSSETSTAFQTIRRRLNLTRLARRRREVEETLRADENRASRLKLKTKVIDELVAATYQGRQKSVFLTEKACRDQIHRMLDVAKIWDSLAQELFFGILLLIPPGYSHRVERCTKDEISNFVQALKRQRGQFLSRFEDKTELIIKTAFTKRGAKQKRTVFFQFEYLNNETLEALPAGSEKLLSYCEKASRNPARDVDGTLRSVKET